MRPTAFILSLAVAAAAQLATAAAADWTTTPGGVKDRGGVPVPAPVPYAETFKWYLRADIGGGWTSTPDVKEQGMTFGYDRLPAEGPPFGMNPAWFDADFDTFAQGGIGAGAYLTPRWRADVTVDARTKSEIKASGSYSYTIDPIFVGPNRRVDGSVTDKTDVRTTVSLVNLYLDLAERGSRLVPYIGVGVGAAVRSVDRRHSTKEDVIDTTTGLPAAGAAVFTASSKAHQLAPAVAAYAGVGYTIGPDMVLDLSYRYTYIGEIDFGTNVKYSLILANQFTGAQSRMTIGDTHEHTLRAGIRWNVW
jgi:opacity protein-like surface antigen